jgi:molybdenum cofactor biosynthesis enzyme MoaA
MSKKIVRIKTMEKKNRLRIEFMVGNYCNYKCNYCGDWANGGTHRWPQDFDTLLKHFRHLLDFYVANGRDDFEINLLGGEPTLWPNVAEFSRIMKSEYNAKLTLTTNGSRTIRWWEQNADAFDKILFSYHHIEVNKFSSIEKFIEVIDTVYDMKVPLNTLVLMDTTCWDEVIEAMEIMKSKSRNPWFICAMEVHPPRYTPEQRKIFVNNVKRRPPIWRLLKDEHENFWKGKTKVVFDDGSTERVERNYFSTRDLNYFEGWMCNIGIENINIQKDGKITGVCGNRIFDEDTFYNIYDPEFTKVFNPKLVPTLCESKVCWCQPEMLMTKWKV